MASINRDGLVKTISENIVKYRKKAGLKQIELAEKLDVGKARMNNIERGKSLIEVDTLIRLSSILNVSVDSLLGLADEKDLEFPLEFNELDEHDKELILLVIRKLTENQKLRNSELQN